MTTVAVSLSEDVTWAKHTDRRISRPAETGISNSTEPDGKTARNTLRRMQTVAVPEYQRSTNSETATLIVHSYCESSPIYSCGTMFFSYLCAQPLFLTFFPFL